MPETSYPVTAEIASVAEYLALLKQVQAEWEALGENYYPTNLWFRGQKDDWPLLPRVLRSLEDPETGQTARHNEFFILNAFTSLYGNYIVERFEPESVQMLALMQHNGVPTRLLDWTESALVGLFFAVEEVRSDFGGTPVVWIICPGRLNTLALKGQATVRGPFVASISMVTGRIEMIGREPEIRDDGFLITGSKEKLSAERLSLPVAFYPISFNNLRLAVQKGCFTIHGTDPVGIDALFINTSEQCFLKRVNISKEAAGGIREELRVMGITPRSLFPDLNGLAQELRGREYFLTEAPAGYKLGAQQPRGR
jgi:hypothetical protein